MKLVVELTDGRFCVLRLGHFGDPSAFGGSTLIQIEAPETLQVPQVRPMTVRLN
jgi:hypothetical protein